MPADPEARRAAFAAFVRRALDHARVEKGWSTPKVAKESGIGVNTLYQWQRGQWSGYPKGEQVERFCDALDVPTSAAYAILWPGKASRPAEPEPFGPDPDFQMLIRKLRDDSVPEQEKYLIRETVRTLAARPNRPPDAPGRRNAG